MSWFPGETGSLVCPLSATSSWIQVNLGQTRKVTGIVIQGCPQNDHWVTKYKLQHSMDGAGWTDYTADGDVSKTGFVLHLLRENICISRIYLFHLLKMTSISCPVFSPHIWSRITVCNKCVSFYVCTWNVKFWTEIWKSGFWNCSLKKCINLNHHMKKPQSYHEIKVF